MSYKMVTMGSDPEVAVIDASSGKVIPASVIVDRFKAIKDIDVGKGQCKIGSEYYEVRKKPTRVGDVYHIKSTFCGPSLVVDGIAFEINTTTSQCKRGEVVNIAIGMNAINSILDTVNSADKTNYKTQISPAIYVSDENLKEFPEQAAVFGCDPDVPIYGDSACKVVDATKHNHRYFGGHLHMSMAGLDAKWFAENMYDLTMILDRLVGIGTTAINKSEEEHIRRSMYGQAGRIRVQPYGGIEYRTPSNSWLLDSSMLIFALHLVQISCNLALEENKSYLEILNKLTDIGEVVKIINSGDSNAAMQLFDQSMKAIDYGKEVLNICNAWPDNYLKYAQYIYDKGGAHEVFNPNEAKDRWMAQGFHPGYDKLRGVDRFVFTEIEPKNEGFLSQITYAGWGRHPMPDENNLKPVYQEDDYLDEDEDYDDYDEDYDEEDDYEEYDLDDAYYLHEAY